MIDNRYLLAASTAATALDVNLPNDEKKGLTIVRAIISLALRPLNLAAPTNLTLAIALVEADAAAAAVLPDPDDPADRPGWLWRETFGLVERTLDVQPGIRVERDLRLGRRLQGSTTRILLLGRNLAPGLFAGSDIDVAGMIRILALKA